jgi:hypothetical protein
VKATNLERLVMRKWNELPGAFKILSKIERYSKEEDRMKELLNENRYSP